MEEQVEALDNVQAEGDQRRCLLVGEGPTLVGQPQGILTETPIVGSPCAAKPLAGWIDTIGGPTTNTCSNYALVVDSMTKARV